jgi:dTDP-glucose pyrophosphorylase
MKGLVLAAGKGTRLNSAEVGMNKCMTLVHGTPIIERVLENLSKMEAIKEVVVVVGFRAEDIMKHLGNRYKHLKIRYAVQQEQKGVVNGIESARDAIDGDDFLLYLGDEIMVNPRHSEMIEHFNKTKPITLIGYIVADDIDKIKKTYTYTLDDNGNINCMVEKPEKPFNNLMGTGSIVFRNDIFEYMDKAPVNPIRNEKELCNLIQTAINNGERVGDFQVADYFVNVNTKDEVNETNQLSL